MFKLSKRSLGRLEGVKEPLVDVVKRAIEITSIDFGITQGLRDIEEQRLLVSKGASQTMKSKHLTGDAVDVVAYLGPRVSWEISLYDEIASAFKKAATELNVPIRWGGAWHIHDITKWGGSMDTLMKNYINMRAAQGRRPFIDAPHFELS
jgi:hypothetical protein